MTVKARRFRIGLAAATLAVATAASWIANSAHAGTLAVNVAFKGASQRAVWQSVFDDFHKAHPDIDVKASFIDEEATRCNCLAGSPPSRPTS